VETRSTKRPCASVVVLARCGGKASVPASSCRSVSARQRPPPAIAALVVFAEPRERDARLPGERVSHEDHRRTGHRDLALEHAARHLERQLGQRRAGDWRRRRRGLLSARGTAEEGQPEGSARAHRVTVCFHQLGEAERTTPDS
jgi:hypothetical protein